MALPSDSDASDLDETRDRETIVKFIAKAQEKIRPAVEGILDANDLANFNNN